MAAVNQPIPNFTGGVSQQPDSRKFPGQLRVCDNIVPDLVHGLIKRPPGEFLSKLANANDTGFWYEIIRDGDEKFLVQITPANHASNPIRVWALTTVTYSGTTFAPGAELTVNQANSGYSYLNGCTSAPGVLALQDYTLVTNPQKVVQESGNPPVPILQVGSGPTSTSYGDGAKYAHAELDVLSYNTEYVLYNTLTPPTRNTYWRVTGMSIDFYDDDGGTNWIQGNTDNHDHTVGPTFIENHGHNPPDGDHGKYNGQILWSANGGGPNVFVSCRSDANLTHYASSHNDAKTLNGVKVNCFKLTSISNNTNDTNFSWNVGDVVHINFNSRKNGSSPGNYSTFSADGDFEVIHRVSNTEIWCWAPSAPSGSSDTGDCTIRPAIYDVQGGVTVNSVNFQDTDERLFDADDNDEMDTSGDSSQFLGFGYDTKYTAEVTIRSGGIIKLSLIHI